MLRGHRSLPIVTPLRCASHRRLRVSYALHSGIHRAGRKPQRYSRPPHGPAPGVEPGPGKQDKKTQAAAAQSVTGKVRSKGIGRHTGRLNQTAGDPPIPGKKAPRPGLVQPTGRVHSLTHSHAGASAAGVSLIRLATSSPHAAIAPQ